MPLPLIFDGRPPPIKGDVQAELNRGHEIENFYRQGGRDKESVFELFRTTVRQIRRSLNLPVGGELILTSSGEEAVHSAIIGAVWGADAHRGGVLTVEGDPEPFGAAAGWCRRWGIETRTLKPLADGNIAVAAKDLNGTAVFAFASIAPLLNSRRNFFSSGNRIKSGTLIAVDLTQAAPVDADLSIFSMADLIIADLTALGAPDGCGMLWIKSGVHWGPLLTGRDQGGKRAGGFSLGFALAAAKAVELSVGSAEARRLQFSQLTDAAVAQIKTLLPKAKIPIGSDSIPAGLCAILPGLEAEAVVLDLAARGISIAAASACGSATGKPAPILTAIGLSSAEASGAVYFTWRDEHTVSDVQFLIKTLAQSVRRLSRVAGDP